MIMTGGDPDRRDHCRDAAGRCRLRRAAIAEWLGRRTLMSLPLRDAREIFEREYLMAQINRFGGNISRTAEFVGMERSALHRKLRALGVSGTGERAPANDSVTDLRPNSIRADNPVFPLNRRHCRPVAR